MNNTNSQTKNKPNRFKRFDKANWRLHIFYKYATDKKFGREFEREFEIINK